MAEQTIAERFCRTANLVARHSLQDEAATVGAQGVVSEQLEAKLTRAEAEDTIEVQRLGPVGPVSEGQDDLCCR
jgi:hypothetical protein